MRTAAKSLFAALTATTILALTITTASANHLSTNEKGFRITWTSLELALPIGTTVRCPITLEGEFTSATINKTAGAVIGNDTVANVNSAACTGGHMTILRETLPWKVSYEAFTGALPNITGIKLLLLAPRFRIETSGLTCLTAELARIALIMVGSTTNGQFTAENIREETESFTCGGIGGNRLQGAGTVTKRGRTERIVITLI